MHNFIWRALVTVIIWYYSIPGTLTKHIFTLRGKPRKFLDQSLPFPPIGPIFPSIPWSPTSPTGPLFPRRRNKEEKSMDGFCHFFPKALFRSLLLLFFLGMASLHVWQSQNEWSPKDGWRRTAQISATVGYNGRTLQGTLVELPVQMPRNIMLSYRKY